MIWDSYFWKRELQRTANRIRRLANKQDGAREKNDYELERSVMVGFYSIRKLIESMKVTSSCANTSVTLEAHPSLYGEKNAINHLNWHRIFDFYDFNIIETKAIRLSALCNLFIHSFIFMPVINTKRNIDAILITSDRTKYNFLYLIKIKDITALFKKVALNFPNKIHILRADQVTDEILSHFKQNGIKYIKQDGYLYAHE